MLPVGNGRLIASLIPGCAARRSSSGVGHMFWWEQPERTAELVRAHALAARTRGGLVQRAGQPAARVARERVVDAERVEDPDDDPAQVVLGAVGATAIASMSRSTAFCGSPPSSAAKACDRVLVAVALQPDARGEAVGA